MNELNLFENNGIGIHKDILQQLNDFNLRLNEEPERAEIQTNKFANNSKYLPISFLEMTLDEITLGHWHLDNFHYQVIANEIVGDITLNFLHPITKVWIKRVGAGAVQIQMISSKNGGTGDITDIRQKIVNTLSKDFPHLKAECFRNACLSIGKAFGRDLNRQFADTYKEFHTDKISKLEYAELVHIVKANNIKVQIVKELLNSYGFEKGEDVTKDLFEIIKGELNEL